MKITKKEIKDFELKKPTYKFVTLEEGEQEVSLIKTSIAKIQKTATTFTLYDVYRIIGQYDRQIAEGEAAIDKFISEKELFEIELKMIEEDLGVVDGVKKYAVETAVETAVGEAKSS